MAYQFAALTTSSCSATLILDPKAKSTTVQVGLSAASTGSITVNLTLMDPTQALPAGAPSSLVWSLLSSGAAMLSSVVFANGNLTYTILSPVGGINALTSQNGGTVYLTALQSVTA